MCIEKKYIFNLCFCRVGHNIWAVELCGTCCHFHDKDSDVWRSICVHFTRTMLGLSLLPAAVKTITKATSTPKRVFLKTLIFLCVWAFLPHVNSVLGHLKLRFLKTPGDFGKLFFFSFVENQTESLCFQKYPFTCGHSLKVLCTAILGHP